MIGIDYRPTHGTATSIGSLDGAPNVDSFGIVSPSDSGTNTISIISGPGQSARRAQVAKSFERAVIENGDLLRRLAD